jgi:hypothetical protein
METKEKELDEKKLSAYSLELCSEVEKVLPYISNMRAAKRLMQAYHKYMMAFKKLGGK